MCTVSRQGSLRVITFGRSDNHFKLRDIHLIEFRDVNDWVNWNVTREKLYIVIVNTSWKKLFFYNTKISWSGYAALFFKEVGEKCFFPTVSFHISQTISNLFHSQALDIHHKSS